MLSLLLDENISDEVADQIAAQRPDILIVSLRQWEEGRHLSADDETILRAAASAGLTMVTYDQRTIPPLLGRLAERGISHGGVIFVDHHTIRSNDFGGLGRSLIALWDEHREWDWTDRLAYLRSAPG
jgi:hypothetical protein